MNGYGYLIVIGVIVVICALLATNKKFVETLKNIYKIEELRKRILYTLGLLLVYRLGCFVYKSFGFATVFLIEVIMAWGYDWERVFVELAEDCPLCESASNCGFVDYYSCACGLLGDISL